MGCLKATVNFIRYLDLFPSADFLRYKGAPCYKTATGGFVSVVILAVFLMLFFNEGLKTIHKEKIISSLRTEKEFDPSLTVMNLTLQEGFMFALGVGPPLNLNDPNITYFQTELTHYAVNVTSRQFKRTDIPLVPCTRQHFSMNEQTLQAYSQFATPFYKCPPMNYSIPLQGRFLSSYNQFLKLKVKQCNSTLRSNCVNFSTLDSPMAREGFRFRGLLLLMGYSVNADQSDYLQPFVETRNDFSFTLNGAAVEGDVYVEEKIVETDESLIPLSSVRRDRVLSVEQYASGSSVEVIDGTYVDFGIRKSPIQRVYTRSFMKLDDFLSYVGGIIGTIIGFLFLLHIYARQAFSISIGSKLMLTEDGDSISSTGFHLGYFLLMPFRRLLKLCNICPSRWKMTDLYLRCMDEVNAQIDVLVMHKKIIFLERAFTVLLGQHQFEALHLFEKQRIDEAEIRRKKYDLQERIKVEDAEESQKSPEGFVKNKIVPIETDQSDNAAQLSLNSFSQMNMKSQQRLRTHLEQLIHEASRGDSVSNSIFGHINPSTLARVGLQPMVISSPTQENDVVQEDVKMKEGKDHEEDKIIQEEGSLGQSDEASGKEKTVVGEGNPLPPLKVSMASQYRFKRRQSHNSRNSAQNHQE